MFPLVCKALQSTRRVNEQASMSDRMEAALKKYDPDKRKLILLAIRALKGMSQIQITGEDSPDFYDKDPTTGRVDERFIRYQEGRLLLLK